MNHSKTRLRKHLAIVACYTCLTACSSHDSTSSAIVGVGASPPGGILPPPPPPPPPIDVDQNRSLLSKTLMEEREEESGVESNALVEPLEAKPDEEGGEKVPTEGQIFEDDTLNPIASTEDNIRNSSSSSSSATNESKRTSWESAAPSTHQQEQPSSERTQQYYPKEQQQQWGYALTNSDQYYNQQWQQPQQQSTSWDQIYQQPLRPLPPQSAQQQYYEQQQYQQHKQHQQPRQPYQNMQQRQNQQGGSLQEPRGQLALYRPQHPHSTAAAQAKKSASGLFSLAVKKLQTGIDNVSESFDVNKVTSSVSGLTSRIGTTIGSTKIGGGGVPPPHRGMAAGQRRPMGGGGGGAGMRQPPQQRSGQQSSYPQRIPSGQRRPPQQQQQQQRPVRKDTTTYAPPMSELFSLDQESEKQEATVELHAGTRAESPVNVDDDTTDGGEEEAYPDMDREQGWQESMPPRQQEPDRQSKPFPMEASLHGRIPPQSQQQPAGRSPQPIRRLNGRVPSNPTAPAAGRQQKRYQGDDDDDDDDYYSSSIGHKMKSALGACVPRVSLPKLFRGSDDMSYNDDGSWSDDESGGGFFSTGSKSKDIYSVTSSSRGASRSPSRKSTIVPGPVQSLLERRETMLSPLSTHRCASIGRLQALVDVAQLALVVCALREVVPLFFHSLSSTSLDGASNGIRQTIVSTILSALDGWTPYALTAAFLLTASNNVWIQPALQDSYLEAASQNTALITYAQLYLRLMTSLPIPMSKSSISSKETMERIAKAHAEAIASAARLHSFVTLAILYILVSTVAVVRPAGAAAVSAAVQVAHLGEWKERPIEWKAVLDGIKNVGLSLARDLGVIFTAELDVIKKQPLRVAVVMSLLAALVCVSYLPSLERGRQFKNDVDEGSEGDEEYGASITSLWSNIGASSATRLGILSSPRGVQGALEQFAKLRPDRAAAAGIMQQTENRSRKNKSRHHSRSSSTLTNSLSIERLLRKVLYSTSSTVILSVPLALALYVSLFASMSQTEVGDSLSIRGIAKTIPENGWTSLLELATLLFFSHLRTLDAANVAVESNRLQLGHSVTSFFAKLASTTSELQSLAAESSSGADFQAQLTSNPIKGIAVVDLWAAHSSRRAWAVRGANVQCQNGEVVLILGTDGAGKTRLLTAVAERIFAPPKAARTTTYVRGSINVGGVELSKWDRKQLQKRVGVYLNDVRTVSDYASLMAGCTLEEILEPVPLEVGGRIGLKEKNAMAAATKITGLSSKLLPRLPSKLSTVLSANEDELKPSALRPPSYPLCPVDWSRVLLTKTLAQLISGNENQLSSHDTVRKCMIGSILLLDDATAQMSEADEAHLISALRSTGAAVLLTSNRWAAGRFADRIVVVSAGSVVESGTHRDLVNLGPERSVYAREWSAMSSA